MSDFKFIIPLQKSFDTTPNVDITTGQIGAKEYIIEGIASTTSVDRDTERMSEKALKQMTDQFKTMKINLFSNHDHNWESTLGVIKDADLIDNKVKTRIKLENPEMNPKVKSLMSKMDTGIQLGLSVGGKVIDTFKEFNKVIGTHVNVIDSVKLFELSVVGLASNEDTTGTLSIPGAIAKSFYGINPAICPLCYNRTIFNKGKQYCDICFWRE